jgi:hypothetical protein
VERTDEVHIGVGQDHAEDLLRRVEDALDAEPASVALDDSRAATAGGFGNLESALPATVVLCITGPSIARSLAAVIVEYIRSRKRNLQIHAPDGTTVEVTGVYTKEDVEKLLDRVIADRSSSSG